MRLTAKLQWGIRGHTDLAWMRLLGSLGTADSFMDIGFYRYCGVNHGANCPQNFWSYAKRRMIKFNGLIKRTFYMHIKEAEFDLTIVKITTSRYFSNYCV